MRKNCIWQAIAGLLVGVALDGAPDDFVTENADESHPAILRFWIPQECAKINAVKLSWRFDQFRAYETGADAGGSEVTSTYEGGESSKTSESGGGTKVNVPSRTVSTGVKYTGSPIDTDGSSSGYTGGPKTYSGNGDSRSKPAGDGCIPRSSCSRTSWKCTRCFP